MPCISAAAIFQVPTNPSFVLAAELLALASELAVEALCAEALSEEAEALAEELAAEELVDPPHATSARHATMRQTIAAITAYLIPRFLLAFMKSPFRLSVPRRPFPLPLNYNQCQMHIGYQ